MEFTMTIVKYLFCIITIYHLKALYKMCKPKSNMNERHFIKGQIKATL